MATIVAAAGGGNWSTGTTWVGGVIPTASDDVQLTSTSGNVTINATAACRSLDCTGYTGTLTQNTNITLTIGTSTAGPANVALVFSTAMTYTAAVTTVTSISFTSTVASTIQTIDFGNKTANGHVSFSAAATSGYKLVTNGLNTGTTNTLTVLQGSLDTNNLNCTWGGGLVSNGTLTRSLIFGTSTITLSGISIAVVATTSNITISASSSTVIVSATAATSINLGGSTTWGNIIINSMSVVTLTASGGGTTIGNFTATRPTGATDLCSLQLNTGFTITGNVTLTGESATKRLLVYGQLFVSRSFGMTASGVVTASNVDLSDIRFTGLSSSVTGTSLGDMGNNSGITFDTPVTQYWIGNGGNWSDATHWSTSSGGAANGRVPLPQDPVVFDGNSITASGQTVFIDMGRAGASWDFSAVNRAVSWTNNSAANVTVLGSVAFSAFMTRTTGIGATVLGGRGSHTVTMAGNSFQGCIVNCGTGVYTLLDALNVGSNIITVTAGTLNTNGMAVGALSFVMTNANSQKTLNLGSSTVTLTGNASNNAWNVVSALTTINAGTSTIVITNTGNYVRTFTGAGLAYNNLIFTASGAPNQLVITGANTFNTLQIGPGRQLTLPASTTNVCNVFNVAGTNYGYVYLPGQTGNYASVPSSTALSITGDIDIQCKVALDNWAGSAQAFVVKESSTSVRSYRFEIGSQQVDKLSLVLSADGVSQTIVNSTVTTGLAAGTLKWVRATWRQSDGRVQFFTSDDGTAWTQLGADQTISIASIFVTNAIVEMGTRNTGFSFPLAGKMYRAIIKNGIDGTTVLDANFSTKPFGANTFTESSANAAIVTINGSLAQAGDGRVLIDSSTSGTAAALSKSNGYVNGDYLAIKDSAATGGAAWYAGSNSVDISGNSGWSFSSGASLNGQFMEFFD